VLHRVDRGHREALVDEHLELGAVGLAQVRLIRRAVIGVGLDALDRRARDLGHGRGLDLRRGVAREEGLALAVAADVPALAGVGPGAAGRLTGRAVALSGGGALCGGGLAGGAREGRAAECEGAHGGDGREPLGDRVGHGEDFLPVA
jgi:hypothetical protein